MDDPNAGAESGRVPALIGVETALAEADWPTTLLLPLMPAASGPSDTSIVRLFLGLSSSKKWFHFTPELTTQDSLSLELFHFRD